MDAAGPGAEWWSAAVDYALVGNADMEGADDAGAPADVTARREAVATAVSEAAERNRNRWVIC